MQITRVNKLRLSDPETGYWAEYDWATTSKAWYCRPGQASEGFFEQFPEIRRSISEHEMLLMLVKYSVK